MPQGWPGYIGDVRDAMLEKSKFKHNAMPIVAILDHVFFFTVARPGADCKRDYDPVPAAALQGHFDDVAAGVSWSRKTQECQIPFQCSR